MTAHAYRPRRSRRADVSLYGTIWSLIPGPLWLRVTIALVLVVGVVAVLFQWGFPALAPVLPFGGNTVPAR